MTNPPPPTDWHARARELSPETRPFIGGQYVDAARGGVFATINPATGLATAQIAACDAVDADHAVAVARAAFEAGHWANASPAHRKTVLLRLADLIKRERDHLALLETLDTGKPIRDSLAIDLPATIRCLRWFAEAIDKLYDEIAPTQGSVLSMVRRVPLGVVAAIVPWNFPLKLSGQGRDKSLHAFDNVTQRKSVWLDLSPAS